jgi:putative nucleotidyltransferase with HDIG domain
MQKPSLNELLNRVGELPPMPAVAQRALALIRDPNSNMASLAGVLAMDGAMTGLVLRWANSAYFGLKFPVTTVQQAVVYLGHKVLHSLILAASMAAVLDRPAPGYGLERGELWRHSIAVAAGARLVAAPYGSQVAEEAYHAGLLCDVGKLAFDGLLRGVELGAPEWQGRSFSDLEIAFFGVDHATLGAALAQRWNLPAGLIEAIAYHHRPSLANGKLLVDAVHLADAATMMLGIGLGRDGLQYSLDPAACARLNWDEAKLNQLLDRVVPFVQETDQFLHLM